MSQQAVIVFTAKSVEHILQEGGTAAWRLDRNHARKCPYAICIRNAYADWTEGDEPHHTAFLIGKIKSVVPAPETDGRFLVEFSEYARLNLPDAWQGGRNPVSYGTLDQLGIDASTLLWEPMPAPSEQTVDREPVLSMQRQVAPLTMTEAKQGLALAFGVKPEAVEITIRG